MGGGWGRLLQNVLPVLTQVLGRPGGEGLGPIGPLVEEVVGGVLADACPLPLLDSHVRRPDAGAWVAACVCLRAVRQLVYEPEALKGSSSWRRQPWPAGGWGCTGGRRLAWGVCMQAQDEDLDGEPAQPAQCGDRPERRPPAFLLWQGCLARGREGAHRPAAEEAAAP